MDIGFLFLNVLVVIVFIERLLARREKRAMLEKLNMVIGAFFSEVGLELLRRLSPCVAHAEDLKARCGIRPDWKHADFVRAEAAAAAFPYEMTLSPAALRELRAFLGKERDFMVRLLENPSLLEHDRFTDLLWAVFHLAEELEFREGDLEGLPAADLKHLKGDARRAYSRSPWTGSSTPSTSRRITRSFSRWPRGSIRSASIPRPRSGIRPPGAGSEIGIGAGEIRRGYSERHASRIAAGLADALEGAEAEQLDPRRKEAGLHRLVPQQVGAQVLLVVVGEDRDDHGVAAQRRSGPCSAPRKLAPGGDADAEAELGGELLGHEDGVAVVHGDDRGRAWRGRRSAG